MGVIWWVGHRLWLCSKISQLLIFLTLEVWLLLRCLQARIQLQQIPQKLPLQVQLRLPMQLPLVCLIQPVLRHLQHSLKNKQRLWITCGLGRKNDDENNWIFLNNELILISCKGPCISLASPTVYLRRLSSGSAFDSRISLRSPGCCNWFLRCWSSSKGGSLSSGWSNPDSWDLQCRLFSLFKCLLSF